MEIIILIVTLVILVETTVILLAKGRPEVLRGGNGKRKVYVDTSALMDGRILSIAQTGFMSDDLIIPRSVIRELQLLADGKDSEKRARARYGMDVANELERVIYCNVEILQDDLDRTAVDERLLQLAKENGGMILTTDFNLGKVAATENIEVLNVNDLALVLRSEYLPGEKVRIKITGEGSNPNQGIGHLSDGTMVVIDNAANLVGEEVEVTFIRFLQTSAGRMLFAKLASTPRGKRRAQRGTKNRK